MGKTSPSRTGPPDEGRTNRAEQLDFTPASGHFVQQVKNGLSSALERAGSIQFEDYKTEREKLLLAISGGPDSTALALATSRLVKDFNIELHFCHINHELRANESDADEQFCNELATSLRIPLTVRRMSEYCSVPSGHAAEEILRSARYALLRHSAAAIGARIIVTGHTLDDQVETMLFRLFRGTGPGGMLGMEIARPLDETTYLLRPMLALSRADCQMFLDQASQSFMCDSSNQSLHYTRNYIRLQVMPAIRSRFPGFEARVQNLRAVLEADERLLEELASSAQKSLESHAGCTFDRWNSLQFATLPESLQRRLLTNSMQARGIAVSFDRIQSTLAICLNGGAATLSSEWDIRAKSGCIEWVKGLREAEDDISESHETVVVRLPGLTIAPTFGCALKVESWSAGNGPEEFPGSTAAEALVDFANVKLPLEIRRRRKGDRIRPFGMDSSIRLKKFLHNNKSDLSVRKSALLLADQEEVLWIPGIGLSNKIRVTTRPSHRLSWLEIAQDEGELC